jgi:hypothetical protein
MQTTLGLRFTKVLSDKFKYQLSEEKDRPLFSSLSRSLTRTFPMKISARKETLLSLVNFSSEFA